MSTFLHKNFSASESFSGTFIARIGALLAALLLVSAAFAHDMYLLPARFALDEGTLLTIRLHNGDSFPASEVSPVLERVRDMKLLSATGAWNVQNIHVAEKTVQAEIRIPQSGSFILTAHTIPHAFQIPAKDFNAYLKEEGLNHVIAWREQHRQSQTTGRERYSKYAKALLTTDGRNEFHTHPAGLAIEIVPEISPYDLKPGADLPIQILLHGMPAPDLQVETSLANAGAITKIAIVGRTDQKGRLTIPHLASGKWRLHTVSMERCKDAAEADWESTWASLTFELP
jgi:uncharacterized GH25 family protein